MPHAARRQAPLVFRAADRQESLMSSTQPLSHTVSDLGTRIVYMALFALVFWVLCWTLALTAIGQLLVCALNHGRTSSELTRLGAGLGAYARQVIEFLTFASDIVPYPFTAWPG
jgi:hypothetical protein